MFKIAQIRKERGLRQLDLAETAGIRVATLSEIERGLGNPEMETLKAIAAALNLLVIDLFDESARDPRAASLLDRFRRLDPARQQALLEILGA